MILGIKPTVDFAFKKIFGSPENATALIELLNAILALSDKIVSVQILNPFNYQEFAESKQNAIEVHTVELSKYNLSEETISEASKLEQWAFLLLRAQDYEAATLTRVLTMTGRLRRFQGSSMSGLLHQSCA